MPYFVSDQVALFLNSRVIKSDGTATAAAIITPNGLASKAPQLKSYLEIVNHLLKQYAYDQATTDADAVISLFTQPAEMTILQYREDLFAKAFRLGDVY